MHKNKMKKASGFGSEYSSFWEKFSQQKLILDYFIDGLSENLKTNLHFEQHDGHIIIYRMGSMYRFFRGRFKELNADIFYLDEDSGYKKALFLRYLYIC